MAWTGGVTTSDVSDESYGYSAAGMLTSIAAPELGAQDTVGGVALARSARSAQSSQSAQSTGVETRGTLVTRVGKTSYTYDKLGRVTETVTRRSSLKPLVKRFSYAGSTGQVTGFSSSDAPGVRWVYSYDGLGRRVAKTCLNADTGEVVSRQVFTYVGHDLVAEHTTVGDASGVVGRVWVQDPGTGEMIGQINLNTTNYDTASGVDQWSQAQVDAVFYALVADLAGAPQELIDTEQGSVVGHVTQSLFGRRSWSGVDSPVLFAGQYEDAESGWVYNRFRFYDPAGGVYGSQDPLGVGPNVGTPQGYVHNPLVWVDALGLEACKTKFGVWNDTGKNAKELRSSMVENGMTAKVGDDAHHMVPARLNRGKAESVREMFKEFDVPLNSHHNGEFLPNTKVAGDPRLGHHGSGVHSKAEMNSIHSFVKDSGTREQFIQRLDGIRDFHQNGVLMSQVQEMAATKGISMNDVTLAMFAA